jgi:hypothetical protein
MNWILCWEPSVTQRNSSQKAGTRSHQIEIEFLDSGVKGFDFTFG